MLDDVAMFDNWANDSEVTRYLLWQAHATIETTRQVCSSGLTSIVIQRSISGLLCGRITVCLLVVSVAYDNKRKQRPCISAAVSEKNGGTKDTLPRY